MPISPRSVLRARDPITHEIHLIELEASMALCGTIGSERLTFTDGAEPMDRHCVVCIRRYRGEQEPSQQPAKGAGVTGWSQREARDREAAKRRRDKMNAELARIRAGRAK